MWLVTGHMQNADHYNNLRILMPVFLLLNFLSSFTINFQRRKDKNRKYELSVYIYL